MSQMIGSLLNYLWLQWQSDYSETFPMYRGCHCKRVPLYLPYPNVKIVMTDFVYFATDHPPRGSRFGAEALPEGGSGSRRRRPHRCRRDGGDKDGDGDGGGGAPGARQTTARTRGTGCRRRVHIKRPHGAIGRHRGAAVLRDELVMRICRNALSIQRGKFQIL